VVLDVSLPPAYVDVLDGLARHAAGRPGWRPDHGRHAQRRGRPSRRSEPPGAAVLRATRAARRARPLAGRAPRLPNLRPSRSSK
jgi:hypothetical protein